MKMFKDAILKLTVIYVLILFTIVLVFSSILYSVTEYNMKKHPPMMNIIFKNDEFFKIISERDKQIKNSMLNQILIIDTCILLGGTILCYFLSIYTLKPIKEAYLSQERFVSDASHELRTPISILLMENEVILKDKNVSKDELKKQIQSNLDEGKRLQKLTNYLLELTMKEKLELSEVVVKKAVDEVILELNKIALEKNIKIKNLTNDTTLKANKEGIKSVLNILIENAIKYSPKGKKVVIKNDKTSIRVIDEGIGIKRDDLPFIFDRFYRSDKSRSTKGYGLGLSLAKKLAEQMNMQIIAKNNKVGSTFIIVSKNNI